MKEKPAALRPHGAIVEHHLTFMVFQSRFDLLHTEIYHSRTRKGVRFHLNHDWVGSRRRSHVTWRRSRGTGTRASTTSRGRTACQERCYKRTSNDRTQEEQLFIFPGTSNIGEQDQVRNEQPYCVHGYARRGRRHELRTSAAGGNAHVHTYRGCGHHSGGRKRTLRPYGKVCARKREALTHRRTRRRKSKLQGSTLSGRDRHSRWRSYEWARRRRLNCATSPIPNTVCVEFQNCFC